MNDVILTKYYVPSKDDVDESYDDTDYSDHYCIRITPHKCRCGTVVEFVETGLTTPFVVLEEHVVVVWPEIDDPMILKAANLCLKGGADPHIIRYEKSFGQAVEWSDNLQLIVRMNDD